MVDLKKRYQILTLAGVAGLLVVGVAAYFCGMIPTGQTQGAATGKVTIEFAFARISSSASNQYAVWIEDSRGNYVRTIAATRYTATGGFAKRPESIPIWVKVANWAKSSPFEVQAVSMATPSTGQITVSWDCKDSQGKAVPAGSYVYKVEGTNFWDNGFLWTGTILVGKDANVSTATVEYMPDKERAVEKGMLISQVKADYRQ
jgi:hypothetical protein